MRTAIDLRKVEIPLANAIADRALGKLAEKYKPRDGDAPTIERALDRIRSAQGTLLSGYYALLAESLKDVEMPEQETIIGLPADVKSALDRLHSVFGIEIVPDTKAGLIAQEIAYGLARFHAQMAAMLAAVEKYERTHAPAQSPSPTPDTPKPAPKPPAGKPDTPAAGRATSPAPKKPAAKPAPIPEVVQITVNDGASPDANNGHAAPEPLGLADVKVDPPLEKLTRSASPPPQAKPTEPAKGSIRKPPPAPRTHGQEKDGASHSTPPGALEDLDGQG